MESTSISDVRRMCQRGAFRAYVQGGKVFLEDTATGQVAPLNGENSPANTERRAAPHREDRRGSRVERMFGARDTWKKRRPGRRPRAVQGLFDCAVRGVRRDQGVLRQA